MEGLGEKNWGNSMGVVSTCALCHLADMKHHIRYTGGDLDRAHVRRQDADWLSQQLSNADSHIIPLWRDQNLIIGLEDGGSSEAKPEAVFFAAQDTEHLIEAANEIVFLGLRQNRAVFCADLSPHEEDHVHKTVGRGQFTDLRQAGPVINANDAALMAYARGLLYWHRQHQFCGRCGNPTQSQDGGHMRRCTNTDCGHPTFPRTDPAVIMLVESRPAPGEPPRCLLGNHSKWQEGNFSTLAGFVEPGETLEEAVIREVQEEVGVVVDDVRYQASQPWPFPSSIMLGYWATAVTEDIKIDDDEIQEARWFTADEIRDFGNWGDMNYPNRLPRKDSISRYLIDTWLDKVSG
jgi:NAD+ diphosphatase